MKQVFRSLSTALIVFAMLSFFSTNAAAQDEDAYDPGSVWSVTYVRTHANQSGTYLKDLAKTWGRAMDAFTEAGLIKSYKILSGEAFGDDDFNLMLMMEVENFASWDPNPARKARFDAIEKKLKEEMGAESYDKTVGNYDNIRDILGTKNFRELHLKK